MRITQCQDTRRRGPFEAGKTSAGEWIGRMLIAGVWVGNGLWAKALGMVPRHERIAARVLGLEDAGALIVAIGLAEMVMAGWVLSGFRARLCGWMQILTVALMNALELWRAPDLLLFGRVNGLVALVFIAFVAWRMPRGAQPPAGA